MTPIIVAFLAGVIGNKAWRVAWRVHKHPVSFADAVTDEFSPRDVEAGDRKKARIPHVTEVA
jgi:hypothetical protein